MKKDDLFQNFSTAPVKWKKHLTLVNWRLRDKEHLLRSINRYKIKDYNLCLQDIKSELTTDTEKCAFVIKLVYKDNYIKLPNIIISNLTDLENASKLMQIADLTKFDEAWYCKNQTTNNNAVFGRMLFGNSELFPSRCSIRYEMVWGASARIIEQYPLINNAFISYNRDNWNSVPQVDQLNPADKSESEVLKISRKIIDIISKYVFSIIDFGSFVFSCGCNHLCLEFSYVNGEFSFIDWDSDDDIKVIKANSLGGI